RRGAGHRRVRSRGARSGGSRPPARGLGNPHQPDRQAARLGGREAPRRGEVTRATTRDDGQAAVELALVLPLVALLLLVLVQVGLVVRDQVLVVHAAREAAREAAVDAAPEAARRAAEASSG